MSPGKYETRVCIYICTYIHIYICIYNIHIYIYIDRYREREALLPIHFVIAETTIRITFFRDKVLLS